MTFDGDGGPNFGDAEYKDRNSKATGGDEADRSANDGSALANGASRNGSPKRKVTAETMAASQRDISVSEFFAKNRHLLGFDNPRKALLTTVKEAVDNSLDACEEASILPEIWVHIESTGNNRYKIGVQDNGPGIMKKQIPLIFGKLLYGSKFHRLRMSRGQQGIGISAAGMYGMLTTGKPVKIISKISIRKPSHYYELQIDTKKNRPEILNGKGDGEDIPPGEKGHNYLDKHGIEWVTHYDAPEGEKADEVRSGTRVTIELEGRFHRGRGSVDDYLEQTAIANPHVTLHYEDPEGNKKTYPRSTDKLPVEPKEIKPHPYGVELGRLVTMLKESQATTLSAFLTTSFSRVTNAVARRICEEAKLSTRASTTRIGRQQADALYQAIQNTKISNPSTDCISPIGEECLLKGLYTVVPGEFYVAATRPPSVYRGNPFQIEVALAYGAANEAKKVTREALVQLLDESDARTLRQFIVTTFDGLGPDAADRILKVADMGTRLSPGKLKPKDIDRLARRDAKRQSQRRPIDAGAALRESRSAAISARRLRHHASRDEHQLAALRSEPVSRLAAQRSGHDHGPHGQRVGSVHQRIEGSGRLVSRNPKGTATRVSDDRPQAGDVPESPQEGEAGRRTPQRLPAISWAKSRPLSATSTRPIAMACTISCSKSPNARPPRPMPSSTNADDVSRSDSDFGDNVIIVDQDMQAESCRRRTGRIDPREIATHVFVTDRQQSLRIPTWQRRLVATAAATNGAKPKLTKSDVKTLQSIRGMADGVVQMAERSRAPHLEVPSRSLSNVQIQQVEEVHRDGQRQEQARAVQSVASQELHANDARRIGMQAADRAGQDDQHPWYVLPAQAHDRRREGRDVRFAIGLRSDHRRRRSHARRAPRGTACLRVEPRRIVGNLQLNDSGDDIDCTRMGSGGYSIPSIVEPEVIKFLKCDAKFVLHVEKDTVWHALQRRQVLEEAQLHPDARQRAAAARRPPPAEPPAQRIEAADLLPAR